MFKRSYAVLALFLVPVILASGCINIDPEALAMANPVINQFMSEHPNADLRITHYSAEEAEDIIETIREDCGKHTVQPKEFYLVNITDEDFNAVAWIDWEKQIVECAYKEGSPNQPISDCTPRYKSECYGNYIYWFDSCNNREIRKEYCPLGCDDGTCKTGRLCDIEEIYEEKPDCVCPSDYEMIVIYPRCVAGITGAITGLPIAKAVTTESGYVKIAEEYTTTTQERCYGAKPMYRCVKRERCRSRAQTRCYSGHVYWFDSCGHVQEKKEFCRIGCENGFCKKVEGECWDSDGGRDYYKKGVIETTNGQRLIDSCNDNNTLTEKYCFGSDVKWHEYQCEHGCVDGACLRVKCAAEGELTSGAVAPEHAYSCCDGLESFNPYTEDWVGGGLLCYDPEKGEPFCEHGGTDDVGWYYADLELIRHMECNTSCVDHSYFECRWGHVYWHDSCKQPEDIKEECDYGCEDGECLEVPCVDSDGGWEYNIAGFVTLNNGTIYEDYCDGSNIYEHICYNGEVHIDDKNCTHGCSSGACIFDQPRMVGGFIGFDIDPEGWDLFCNGTFIMIANNNLNKTIIIQDISATFSGVTLYQNDTNETYSAEEDVFIILTGFPAVAVNTPYTIESVITYNYNIGGINLSTSGSISGKCVPE